MGVNCRPEVGMNVLDNVIKEMTNNGVKYQRSSEILHGMDIQLVSCDPHSSIDNYMVQLEEYYGKKDIAVAQVMMPDVDGKLPGENGYCMPQLMLEPIVLN